MAHQRTVDQLEAAKREAVLASVSGSLYEKILEADKKASPEELERRIAELRAIVGPGGP